MKVIEWDQLPQVLIPKHDALRVNPSWTAAAVSWASVCNTSAVVRYWPGAAVGTATADVFTQPRPIADKQRADCDDRS